MSSEITMHARLTNAEKIRGLPWSIASGAVNSVSAQWTFFGPPFVLMLSELGANTGHIGFLLSLFPFTGLLALFLAPAAAAFGNKRTYLVFWAARYCFAAGLLAVPWLQRHAPGSTEAIISGLVLGFAVCRAIGETGYYPWQQEFIPNATRGQYYAAYYSLFMAAGFAAVLVASVVIGQGHGLGRYMGLIAAGVGFGALTVILAAPVPGGAPQRRPAAAGRLSGAAEMKEALRNGQFRAYLLAAGLVVLGSAPLASFQPLLLTERIGLDSGLAVLAQGGVLLGGLAAGYLCGWIADRYGSKPVIMSMIGANVLVPLGWLLVPRGASLTVAAVLPVALAAGAAWNGWLIGSGRLLFGHMIPPDRRTPYTAIHYAWMGVIGGIGPLLAGWLLQAGRGRDSALFPGGDPYPLFLALSAAASVAAFAWFRRVKGDSDISFARFVRMFLRGNPLLAVGTAVRYERSQDELSGIALAERLGEARSPLGVDELIEALDDPRQAVRTEAVIALAHAGFEPRSTQALARVLREEDAVELAALAAWALGRLGDPAAIPALRDAWQGAGAPGSGPGAAASLPSLGPLRSQCARALGFLGDREAIPALREGLRSAPAFEERVACAAALGHLGAGAAAAEVLALLREAVREQDRAEAALAAARLASSDGREHYFVRLWRATRTEPGTGLSQALLALRRRLRGLPVAPARLPGALARCADCCAEGDLVAGAEQLCEILSMLPVRPNPPGEPMALVLAECRARLAEHGPERLEYVILALHALDAGLSSMGERISSANSSATQSHEDAKDTKYHNGFS